MLNIPVAIVNVSTVLQDSAASAIVPALQAQVSGHLAFVWGIDATLFFVSHDQTPPSGVWWLVILDNNDQAGVLGYHDLTNEGLPLGKVFAGSDIANGYSWTVTASHELLEMLIDPDINRTVFLEESAGGGTLYSFEICDPCQADQCGYAVGGVLLSDFVFPAWFESFRAPASTQFDATQQIAAPFQLATGGYTSVYDVATGGGWHQLNSRVMPPGYSARASVGSRRERRRVGQSRWLRSTILKGRSAG